MNREKENAPFHNLLAVMLEGELIIFQSRLPKDRESLQTLWEQQNHSEDAESEQERNAKGL